MSKHTPTPWTVEGPAKNSESYDCYFVNGPDGRAIAEVSYDNQPANAAYIVRAVNCHEELVEALEDAAETIRALDQDYDLLPSYIRVNAILDKA